MLVVAGDVVMELLERGVNMEYASAERLDEVVPFAKGFLKDHSESLGLDSLRCCAVFRKLMKSRPKDSLTDDFEKTSNWQEALTANFCSDTSDGTFQMSLEGKEREWFAALESAEPLTVVTQEYGNWSVKLSPRDVFISRVLSMLLMVAFVLLHIESIKGDSGMTMAAEWPQVWLWGTVLTGSGFILLETFQGIRLKAAYWADSWNFVDFLSSVSIVAFVAIHFMGWSIEAEVGSGIVIALLFALRLLQTASLHPSVGPLILAVVRMFSDISMFLCLYVYILLVFAVVFTLFSSYEDHQYFGSFAKATLTLFYAGLGDFTEALNNAIESHDTLGTALLFTYVILSSIILASTYAAIEETQTGQYQLMRIRVLNEYLTMPQHERLPPPFNLIGRCDRQETSTAAITVSMICVCAAVVVSQPLRYVASLISGHQSALCRIAFWSMRAVYSTIDALLSAVAFTPAAIYRQLEELQLAIRFRDDWIAVRMFLRILLMPLYLLYDYVTSAEESSEESEEVKASRAERRRETHSWHKATKSFDKWMEAADHHDSHFPDVMAALKHFQDKNQSSQSETLSVLKRIDERQTKMEERQMEMDARLKKIENKVG
ncbi:unnamed protein product [Vitrella brassicaformis CCMP3155]|uniref:Ion transport domain-containing protein n=2 Tax=Vitrella brassicaformis TaxID=1169539 RepID=A0A0G4EFI9_VITBC|nr:unnamed protein product [Vitrella brassicaformis CCMP3155]|eukprot:CEL94192.1 unnamed protein product [Vitrella brassicaformis CCMP3155]